MQPDDMIQSLFIISSFLVSLMFFPTRRPPIGPRLTIADFIVTVAVDRIHQKK
jgi:hypothetical protein